MDMAYSRWLMVHLNKPVEAMRAIHRVLKPGGIMVCEEAAERLEELVAGMSEADGSPDTMVAHCRMHQLIARKR